MTRAEILEAARACVCGQRELDYGSPEDNFATIGRFWTTYLAAAHPFDFAAALCLTVKKIIGRDKNHGKKV